jgi:protein tyrosine/serine phosphatase
MNIKKLLKVLGVALLLVVGYYIWYVHFNYRFETIEPNKVYKSAAIPPEKLARYINEHHIKTVIDLRDGGDAAYSELNPVNQKEIDAEREAIAKIQGVKHINIPSPQVPTKQTLTKFFEVLDNNISYPVLIHCYHGTGRAEIYSALYRIEYTKTTNEEARKLTRLFTELPPFYKSSFAPNKDKGKFLIEYKPRSLGNDATVNQLVK